MTSNASSDSERMHKAAVQYSLFERASKMVFKKYEAAIREMRTRFEILDGDLEYRFNRNPIHHIEMRLKEPKSVYEKLERYKKPITLESMEENVLDVAGLRVIVSYIDDVYALVKVLSFQDDLTIVKVKDYIAHPKPNGYRSLHVIVKVPVYFLDRKQYVPVEIQFRTIAMDFWASLEHTLKYKSDVAIESIDMYDELKDCSEIIEDVERRMQILMHAVQTTDVEEAAHKRRQQLKKQAAEVQHADNAVAGDEAADNGATGSQTTEAKRTSSQATDVEHADREAIESAAFNGETADIESVDNKAAKAPHPSNKITEAPRTNGWVVDKFPNSL